MDLSPAEKPAWDWPEFDGRIYASPMMRVIAPNDMNQACRLEARWMLRPEDASCWRRPVELTVEPELPIDRDERELAKRERWETCLYLSREDIRVLRDCFDMMLRSPDLRGEEEP
jgi:hypothetical protein